MRVMRARDNLWIQICLSRNTSTTNFAWHQKYIDIKIYLIRSSNISALIEATKVRILHNASIRIKKDIKLTLALSSLGVLCDRALKFSCKECPPLVVPTTKETVIKISFVIAVSTYGNLEKIWLTLNSDGILNQNTTFR